MPTCICTLELVVINCGHQVGILDVDLCGPSIPRMLNAGRPDVHQCDSGWVPVYTDAEKNLALMSIGFLLEDPDEAVVWRGPKKTGVYFRCITLISTLWSSPRLASVVVGTHTDTSSFFFVL